MLDKSGSMGSITDDTIGGFNTYIDTLKKDKKSEYLFSLTLFDTGFKNEHVSVPLKDVPELTRATYAPSGNTALYDAIGSTVAAVEKKGDKVSKVLTVILTDGQENSSREFRLSDVRALIERKEKEGNWTFVFLGADLSAFTVGDSIGTQHMNSVVYDTSNMHAMMANSARATQHLARGPQGQSTNFYGGVSASAMKSARMMSRATPPIAKIKTTK